MLRHTDAFASRHRSDMGDNRDRPIVLLNGRLKRLHPFLGRLQQPFAGSASNVQTVNAPVDQKPGQLPDRYGIHAAVVAVASVQRRIDARTQL
ncbi:hypothetical protein D3C73_1379680 [compost metagenome]